ncbi:MAG: hypothetical protein KAY37_02320 [Phycisphaerae bacterium]|nr:hypothetical protein [Phycisphaerae bacterium]
MLLGTGCAARWPAKVELALSKAGDNRPELERVLKHYRAEEDPQKLASAQFLIANMIGHGYTVAAFYDEDKNEVPFDALEYGSYQEAQAAMDVLEKQHGELHYARKRFDHDLETITAEYLIENIDLAFQAWREKPWARDLTFEAFREHILPYRGSNEPLNPWRAACLERYADLPLKLDDLQDLRAAAQLLQKDVGVWVRFDELYYLHPTDQGFEEMCERRVGRCEDITNMQMYAMRANAIAAASDYTPFWADRDNNHAWQVILDQHGHGKARLLSRAAKVYRKTFAIQRDSLGYRKRDDEQVPHWLSGVNYIDVTSQYLDTVDVTIPLETEKPENARFAYICVFNGGEWQAIHWGEIDDDNVSFTEMGRHIAYLPAYFVDEELLSAGPPFILTEEGEIRPLAGDGGPPLTIDITVMKPTTPDADTRMDKPMIVVEPGKSYELFVWDGDWNSLGQQIAGDEPVSFEQIPSGRLYWLVAENSRRLERIFTIEDGRQIFW